MRTLLAVLFFFPLSFLVHGQQEEVLPNAAVPWIRIPADIRASGMGDIGVATEADVNAARWNPAKLVWLGHTTELGFSYLPYLRTLINDAFLLGANYAKRINDESSLAVGFTYFTIGEVELRETIDQEALFVQPNTFTLDVAYGLQLNDEVSVGAGLRFISDNQQTPDDLTSDRAGNALAADAGVFYRSRLRITEGNDKRWRAGIALSQIGTPISYVSDGPESPLPSTLRFGVGRDIIYDYDSMLSLTLEANTLVVDVADNSWGFGLGGEYVFRGDLFLRSGYYVDTASNTDRNYLTLGAGVRRGNLLVDMSYLFSTSRVVNPFENTLRVGISFGFGQRFYQY
ncbi:MAG: PorV/PorQ family protein [Flavobacteriaceae bacterium]